MITGEDMNRNLFPEMERRDLDAEIEIDFVVFSCTVFAVFHSILYLVFFSVVVSRTAVFHVIDEDLIFNISEFGRLLYKVFDIKEYFL